MVNFTDTMVGGIGGLLLVASGFAVGALFFTPAGTVEYAATLGIAFTTMMLGSAVLGTSRNDAGV